MSRRALLIQILAIFLFFVSCGSKANSVQNSKPDFAGVWTSTVSNSTGTWTMTWAVNADGGYITSFQGPAPLPNETGVFHAADGTWTVVASSGRKDHGTYQFSGVDTVSMTGTLGTAVWKRTSTQSAQKTGPAPLFNPFAAQVNDLITRARFLASVWHKDAILVEVKVEKPSPDGSLNLSTPGAFTCVFLSATTGNALAVHSVPPAWGGGQPLASTPSATPLSPYWVPLPFQMKDLSEVVAIARRDGFGGSITRAEMNGWDRNGAPYRCGWILYRMTDDIDHSTYCYDLVRNQRFEITEVVDDARKQFEDQAATFQKVLAQWRRAVDSARQRQSAPQQWSSENWYYSYDPGDDSGWEPSSNSQDSDSSEDFAERQKKYDQEVALQNAWENNDTDAYNRISTGESTNADKDAYGGD